MRGSQTKTRPRPSDVDIDGLEGPGLAIPPTHEGVPGYDGRLLRGERTRRHIAQAMIDLIEEGNPKPTVREIADRAGVSMRLVFHHYDDLEAVFQTAAVLQAGRHWKKIVTIPPAGPVGDRIEALCRQRRQFYVAITPVRRAAMDHARDSVAVTKMLDAGRRRLRAELATTFEPELKRARSDAPVLLDAIELASSWENWYALRISGRRSAAVAQRTMQYTLTALLS